MQLICLEPRLPTRSKVERPLSNREPRGPAHWRDREAARNGDKAWEANAPEPIVREGWVFPWRTKSGVYAWLRPLRQALGVTFTPHMARHSVGKRHNDAGAGLRTIMARLGHQDVKSSIRYQAEDIEVVCEAGGS